MSKIGSFKKKLSFRIISRFFLSLVIFTGALIALFLFALFVGQQFTWYPGLIYNILNFIRYNFIFFFLFCWMVGFCLLFIHYWRKTLGYLEDVIRATEDIYLSEDDLITLPEELKEVENQMNQIKWNIMESEQSAKEAEQRKSDLIVYLAHDLKTPLTSVIGYLTLLRDEGQISPELREKYLSISLEKAERLEDLINEFFEITRFNLTTLVLEPTRVNLTRMLEQVAYEFKPVLTEKRLTYELQIEADMFVQCDRDKMQRVFDNILRNAVNYSMDGSLIKITGKK